MEKLNNTTRARPVILKGRKSAMPHKDTKAWAMKRERLDDDLYEQYGQPLEETHADQFIAISDDGQTIVGEDTDKVAFQAIKEFGSGNFAFRKIGSPAIGKWLQIAE